MVTQWREIAAVWPLLAAAIVGVMIGTVAGARVLKRIPHAVFRRLIAVLLFALGIYMIFADGKD